LAALLDFEFEAIVCPMLIEEFRDALTGQYFQERFDPNDLAEIVATVEEAANEYDDPKEIEALLRDPDDDYLVALAREAGADAIVTGDRDLLDHAGLEPSAIAAREACTLLGLNS
jgi:putative PIN family toxin of toxin-antitoxin system